MIDFDQKLNALKIEAKKNAFVSMTDALTPRREERKQREENGESLFSRYFLPNPDKDEIEDEVDEDPVQFDYLSDICPFFYD